MVEGANKSFLKLFGYSPDKPVDGPIADLVRGHRGSPISRARLKGMLTKSEGPVPIQVASADKNFWPAMLYVRPASAEAEIKRFFSLDCCSGAHCEWRC